MPVVTCACGKRFRLDAKYAGSRVRCRHCGAAIQVPNEPNGAVPDPDQVPTRPARKHSTQPALPPKVSQGDSAAPAQGAAGHPYGPYTIVRPHARGGMGKVSVARDEPLKREVALKELLDVAARSPTGQQRFLDEAEITAQLEHPGVVPVYALGMDQQGRPFYTMRLVHGRTLRETIQEYHDSPTLAGLKELIRHFAMVCQTVAYAHARGVIHRDLKPANVMLGQFGETLVMDWGLAKPVGPSSPDSTLGDLAAERLAEHVNMTAPGGLAGTPAYMSPEQALGKNAEVGPASDIYGLGAVLYEVLTGKPPYRGGSSVEVIEQVRSAPPPRPSELSPGAPRALEAICLKAMARDPAERYPGARALAEDVQNWLDDEPVGAYREPAAERVFRWARRHKAAVVSGVGFAVCLIVVASLAAVLVQRHRARALAAESLAQEYARQAAEAQEEIDAKEAEAERLAEEAQQARAEAIQATEKAAQAGQEAGEAKSRIAQLEAELSAKAAQAQELKQNIAQQRVALTAAEARVTAEIERAKAAG